MFGLRKKSKPQPIQPPRIAVVERELASLTISDWRGDAALCAQSRNVLSSPIVRQMVSVLHNSHPAYQVITGDFQARAIQQARCEGYTLALADFEALGVHVPPAAVVPAEFDAEHVSDEDAAPFTSKGKRVA